MPNPHNLHSHPTKAAYAARPTNALRVRQHPPIDSCAGDPGQWRWRTASPVYRRRVKRAIQAVQSYRLMTTGNDYLTRDERDAVHRLLDTLTFGRGSAGTT